MGFSFERTSLWKRTLGEQEKPDEYKTERELLRQAFFNFRDKAATLAAQIQKDLEEFTIHDITHIDALWEAANDIIGENYNINPAEAFVLGGAFLLHDCGMSLAAFPGGIEELKKEELWKDIIAINLKKKFNRTPTKEEINNPDKDIITKTKGRVLRELHAKKAKEMGEIFWTDVNGSQVYLIENLEFRNCFGSLIGRIAQSHWKSVNDLQNEFPNVIGAPGNLPREWNIDPLKLACILRAADASHLDQRRAPHFLSCLIKPEGVSKDHWTFQRKLSRPYPKNERLVFTSTTSFKPDEASSWWVYFDTLKMVDRELREIDSLLTDLYKKKFIVKGVTGIESPERLMKHIRTENWIPIDARIQVSNVAGLVKSLGGKNLYGEDYSIPLRELIQNAADAIRARRIIENREDDWGKIIVRVGKNDTGEWIEVEDNGVGMSTSILTGPFLDFGKSGWESETIIREFPSLLSNRFEPTGQYGIGFFSVFMWGDKATITTRRFDHAKREVKRLFFKENTNLRPILLELNSSDMLRDGGTIIRVWLKQSLKLNKIFNDFLFNDFAIEQLKVYCAAIAPSLDVNLYVGVESNQTQICVTANDWKTIDAKALINRLLPNNLLTIIPNLESLIPSNLKLVRNEIGKEIARICVVHSFFYSDHLYLSGIVTVGGLSETYTRGIFGILIGENLTIKRKEALPILDGHLLSEWATDQANLLKENDSLSINKLIECSEIISSLGGDIKELPFARVSKHPMNYQDIIKLAKRKNELLLLGHYSHNLEEKSEMLELDYNLLDNVVCVSMDYNPVLWGLMDKIYWPRTENNCRYHNYSLSNAKFILKALSEGWGVELEQIKKVSLINEYDLMNKSKRRTFKKLVGHFDNKNEIIEAVDIIRNPLFFSEKDKDKWQDE